MLRRAQCGAEFYKLRAHYVAINAEVQHNVALLPVIMRLEPSGRLTLYDGCLLYTSDAADD